MRPPIGPSQMSEAPAGSPSFLALETPCTLGALERNHANKLFEIINKKLRGIERIENLRQFDSSIENERVARKSIILMCGLIILGISGT